MKALVDGLEVPPSAASEGLREELRALRPALVAAVGRKLLPEEQRELEARHDALLLRVREELPPAGALPGLQAVEAFASGALRACHLALASTGGVPVVDTCGSHTLGAWRHDLLPEDLPRVRRALVAGLGLAPERVLALEEELEPELAQVHRRRRLLEALAALHPVEVGPDEGPQVLALFSALFPGHPLHAEELGLVRTATCVFLCVDHDAEGRLRTRPEDEQAQAFVKSVIDFALPQLAHFPAFGSFRAEEADPALLESLLGLSGLERGALLRELTAAVVVLPTQKVDQYVVHDQFGHTWQSLLFSYEDDYRGMAGLHRAPGPDERLGGLSLRQLILQPELWEQALASALRERSATTLTGLNAEVLADAVEHKLLALDPSLARWMPSSSALKQHPLKLDLTLHDLPHYLRMADRGLRRLEDALPHRPDLQALPRAPLLAFARFAEAWLEAREQALDERAALIYLGLTATWLRVHQELCAQGPPRHVDLLIFSAASLLERDRWLGFQQLEDLVEAFPGLLARFEGVSGA